MIPRKTLISRPIGKGGWGRTYCKFCKKRIIAYNVDRHNHSASHWNAVKQYEKEHGVVVVEGWQYEQLGATAFKRLVR